MAAGLRRFNEAAREIASANGVPFLDFEAAVPKDGRHFSDDVHMTAAAILNVVLNARDAIAGAGSIWVRTMPVTSPSGTDLDVDAGTYVVVEIEDSGAGMGPEILERVFEPFFTTKNDGGTGLGLSMVHGFARQSGGAVTIASRPGHGTTLRIYLPSESTYNRTLKETPRRLELTAGP